MIWDDNINCHSSNQEQDSTSISEFLDAWDNGDILELLKSGDISTPSEALKYLSQSSTTLFRKSTEFKIKQKIWLSKAQEKCTIELSKIEIPNYRNNLSKEFIRDIAKKSENSLSIKKVTPILNSNGICLVFEKYITGSRVDGATFCLPNGTPCIAISARYKRADNIWFTLLHELAHIILHYDSLKTPIIDDFENLEQSTIEHQANNAASNAIQPRDLARTSTCGSTKDITTLLSESRIAGVHPALLAGQTRYKRSDFSLFNEIINNEEHFYDAIKGISF